jgi:hypothetical protein
VRVTVPVEELPPTRVQGLKPRVETAGARSVRLTFRTVPLKLAESVTVRFVGTGLVVRVKVAEVVPARTVTKEGTETAVLLLDSATTAPAAGAGPFNVTVPVA